MKRSRRPRLENTEPSPDEVRRVALDLLARREHTALELRQKLGRRGFSTALVEPTLERLSAEGLLDEARFAEVYAHTRVDKGYGPLRIRQELRERGVPEDVVSDILLNFDDFWMTELAQVHRKRFAGQVPRDLASKAQQTRFLRHRGFTLEQIERFFRNP